MAKKVLRSPCDSAFQAAAGLSLPFLLCYGVSRRFCFIGLLLLVSWYGRLLVSRLGLGSGSFSLFVIGADNHIIRHKRGIARPPADGKQGDQKVPAVHIWIGVDSHILDRKSVV